MSDYITLLGAEQVQSAANTMRTAADAMSSAAAAIDYAMRQQRQYMDDWLVRLEQILGGEQA